MNSRLPGRIEEAWGPLMRSSRFNARPSTTHPLAVPQEELTLTKKDANDPQSTPLAQATERGYLGEVPDKTPNSEYALGGAISSGEKPDPALPQSPTDNPQPPQAPEGNGEGE